MMAGNGRPVRLFISHSSHAEGASERLCAVVDALGKRGFNVMVDKDVIRSGDVWRERINAMLVECDAAVILLTQDALGSAWVLKEATILKWRHDRNERFALVPVLLDGIEPGELDENAHWASVGLSALQAASGDTAEAVVDDVATVLGPLAAQLQPTPLDLLATAIADALRDIPPDYLERVLATLQERTDADLVDDPSRRAREIARWMLRQPPPALVRMANALQALGPYFKPEVVGRIITLVAPLWAPLDAASWFARARPDETTCRDLALQCAFPQRTLQHLMNVAHLPNYAQKVQLLNGVTAGRQADEIESQLIAVVQEKYEARGDTLDEDEVRAQLQLTSVRFFVALQAPQDPDVVRVLRERLQGVTFIFFTAPSERLPRLGAGVAAVTPALDASLEKAVVDDELAAKRTYF
jgi:hypothetical protein